VHFKQVGFIVGCSTAWNKAPKQDANNGKAAGQPKLMVFDILDEW
jgi:hypothetical protein